MTIKHRYWKIFQLIFLACFLWIAVVSSAKETLPRLNSDETQDSEDFDISQDSQDLEDSEDVEEPEDVEDSTDSEVSSEKYPHRISNGRPSFRGQFPSFVLVRVEVWNSTDDSRSLVGCGGTIIGPRYVITAAHCFEDRPPRFLPMINIRVYLPDYKRGRRHSKPFYSVEKVIRPSDYYNGISNPDAEHNYQKIVLKDVALILLSEEIKFNHYIQPAYLPDKPMRGVGVVVGVGATGTRFTPSTPLYTKAKVITCPKSHQHGHTSIMCIKRVNIFGGRVCSGDSGGPFYMKRGNRMIVVGGISTGWNSCKADDLPSELADYYDLRSDIKLLVDSL